MGTLSTGWFPYCPAPSRKRTMNGLRSLPVRRRADPLANVRRTITRGVAGCDRSRLSKARSELFGLGASRRTIPSQRERCMKTHSASAACYPYETLEKPSVYTDLRGSWSMTPPRMIRHKTHISSLWSKGKTGTPRMPARIWLANQSRDFSSEPAHLRTLLRGRSKAEIRW